MNEKCKYCDYVSKCSRKCEYNSILCQVQRSFPKVVDKSYEQLQHENKQLQERINKALNKIDNMFDRGDTNTIIDDLLELDKILKGSDSNE